MVGGKKYSKFLDLYCLKVKDKDGNQLKGRYTINPKTKPSHTMPYGTRNGHSIKKTFPSGREFSMSLLSDYKP